jgi:hypothetical protein
LVFELAVFGLSRVVFRVLRPRDYNFHHVLIIGASAQLGGLSNKLYRYLRLKVFVTLGKSQMRIATMCVLGTWAIMLLGTLVLVNTYTSNFPFSDELYMITQPLTPQWLWEQHAEHRVPLAKLIWLSSLRLSNYDFRFGNSISVLAVGAVAFAMMWTARRLRGWTTFSDSFFPLAFLNFSQAINFSWWWVFNHILAPVLACCLLSIILLKGKQLTPRYIIVTGACLVLLSLSGPGGLPYALALAIWLAYRGVFYWRSPTELYGKRNCLLAIGLAVLAVLLVGLYFVGYVNPAGTAGGQPVPDVSLKTSLETSIQVLSISLGLAVRTYWRFVGVVVLALLLFSAAVPILALVKEPSERLRALGLVLFIGAAGGLVLIVGRARAGLGEEYALSGVYLNMALPVLSCAYFIWIIYGTPAIKSLVQMCLFAITCLFFLPNLTIGLGVYRYFGTIGHTLQEDIKTGVPPFVLAERHVVFLNPATDDVEGIALQLRRMQQVGIPQFRHMAPDPVFREVALPVAPVGLHQVTWRDGVGHSYGDDPSEASVDFAFREPRFVYAVRLTYAYGDTDGRAVFRMSWGGDHGSGGNRTVLGCKGGVSLNLETVPHDMWSRRFRSGSQKRVTIWVNSTIDGFRICPDTKPFSFAASEIRLLVP